MTLNSRKHPGVAAITATAVLLVGADAPTGGQPGVRTWVISNMYFAGGADAGTCAPLALGGVEAFLASLPEAEREQYARPEKRQDLEKLMAERLGFRRFGVPPAEGQALNPRVKYAKLPDDIKPGTPLSPEQAKRVGELNGFPKGGGAVVFSGKVLAYDSCTDPDDFMSLAHSYILYMGKTADGLNLDGKSGGQNFTSPDAQPGVDNQLWRAIGCTKIFRASNDAGLAKATVMSGRAPTLVEVHGIDDDRNDPDVTVTIVASTDPLRRDARNSVLPWSSYAVDPDPRLKATTKGRIVDGVLSADPVDIHLAYKEQIVDAPRDIRGARLRLKLNADGSADGGIYGYYTLESFWDSVRQMTQAGANVNGISCPSMHQAIYRLADGIPDPRTRRKTAISSAIRFVAVPAFATASAGAQTAQALR
jgi:hypothetical protein